LFFSKAAGLPVRKRRRAASHQHHPSAIIFCSSSLTHPASQSQPFCFWAREKYFQPKDVRERPFTCKITVVEVTTQPVERTATQEVEEEVIEEKEKRNVHFCSKEGFCMHSLIHSCIRMSIEY
jgi:hypothetical protein